MKNPFVNPVADSLDIANSFSQNDGAYFATDQVRARDADGLKLYDDGGNGIFVKDAGNVGIGTAAPDSILSIRSANQNAVVNIYGVASATIDYGVIQVSSVGGLTNPQNRPLVLQPNIGKVGIGTTTPAQMLNLKNGHIRLDQVAAPTAATVAVGAAGVLTGNYYYRITFVTVLGETETGVVSALVAPSSQQVNLSAIPISSDTAVTSRKIYRTTAGGSQTLMQLVTTIADNTTTTYSDNIADGSLGVAESRVNTTGGVIYNGTTRAGIIDNSVTAIGMGALRVNTGYYNSAIGISALYSNTTGNYNSAMGIQALFSNTTGNYNSAMGMQALFSNTTGYANSAIGVNALRSNTTGYNNSAVGMQALYSNTTGYQNSAMGMNALFSNTTGYQNSAMGMNALLSNTTGSNNIALGYQAGDNLTTGANNIIIGYNIDAPLATSVNTLNIGNLLFGTGIDGTGTTLSSGNVGIGTTTPTSRLDIQKAGTAKANLDILELTNSGNAADMDGTQTSILFNQWYYDATTPAVADAGRITVGAETDWTSTAATQDSYMSFRTALDGVITEQARVDSSVTAGQTRFLIYDVDNATLERVTVGAQDSGGVGFKLLRIAN